MHALQMTSDEKSTKSSSKHAWLSYFCWHHILTCVDTLQIGGESVGRITMELRKDVVPKTVPSLSKVMNMPVHARSVHVMFRKTVHPLIAAMSIIVTVPLTITE